MTVFEIRKLAKGYIMRQCDNSADDTLGRMKKDARLEATRDWQEILKAIDEYQP